MTQTLDFRLAQGDDRVLAVPTAGGASALANRAAAASATGIHIALADTKTGCLGVKLTARSSGLFLVSFFAQYAAAAADVVTMTVDTYTDAVPSTPMTLPANAALVAGSGPGGTSGVYLDNSGAGIAPTAGAGAANTLTAAQQTVAGVDCWLTFTSLCGAGGPVPVGSEWYAVLSVTNSVAVRAVTQAFASAFELP